MSKDTRRMNKPSGSSNNNVKDVYSDALSCRLKALESSRWFPVTGKRMEINRNKMVYWQAAGLKADSTTKSKQKERHYLKGLRKGRQKKQNIQKGMINTAVKYTDISMAVKIAYGSCHESWNFFPRLTRLLGPSEVRCK